MPNPPPGHIEVEIGIEVSDAGHPATDWTTRRPVRTGPEGTRKNDAQGDRGPRGDAGHPHPWTGAGLPRHRGGRRGAPGHGHRSGGRRGPLHAHRRDGHRAARGARGPGAPRQAGRGGRAPAPGRGQGREHHRPPAALPARHRAHPAAHGPPGGRTGEADRGGRPPGQAEDGREQPAPRGVDREELPQPGPRLPRPDPGGHARAGARRREVRLPQGLQVLDVRHLVDPPGSRPCPRRQGPHHPDAGARRRAHAASRPGRALAVGPARP